MKIKNLNNTAFSLLEILLSAVIFIVSVAGIFATLNAVRTPVIQKENALAAAQFGKQVLEALRAQVDDPQAPLQNYYTCSAGGPTCPDFALSVGTHVVTLPVSGISWPNAAISAANPGGLTYVVSCADGVPADCGTGTDVAHLVNLKICLDAAC